MHARLPRCAARAGHAVPGRGQVHLPQGRQEVEEALQGQRTHLPGKEVQQEGLLRLLQRPHLGTGQAGIQVHPVQVADSQKVPQAATSGLRREPSGQPRPPASSRRLRRQRQRHPREPNGLLPGTSASGPGLSPRGGKSVGPAAARRVQDGLSGRLRADEGDRSWLVRQGADGGTQEDEAHLRHEGHQEGAGYGRRGHRLGADGEARVRDRVQPPVLGWTSLLLPGVL